jgi:hypothetical protein
MLNREQSKRRSEADEKVVKEQFEKLRYSVRQLKSSARRRPDFLISNRAGRPQMLCEVKTIESGGQAALVEDSPPYKKKKVRKGVVGSTYDENLVGSFIVEKPITLKAIDERLEDAVDQRKKLVEDNPSYANLPLLVAFFFDQLANHLQKGLVDAPIFGQYAETPPDEMREQRKRFQDVSGILIIKEDVAFPKAFQRLTDEKQEQLLRRASTTGLPPNRRNFVLLENKAARRRVPKHFARLCLPYDASDP